MFELEVLLSKTEFRSQSVERCWGAAGHTGSCACQWSRFEALRFFKRNEGDVNKLGSVAFGHMPLFFPPLPSAKVFLVYFCVLGSALDVKYVVLFLIKSYLEVRR